jgi:serine/threonine-protein kinase HipA
MTDAKVMLWEKQIGAVTWLNDRDLGVFQYDPLFVESGIQVSPLMMPLRLAPYEFPALPRVTFKGLPGMLADSLPDKFGNAIIDAWLASEGKNKGQFNSVERLCYTGSRGMGALEFKPAIRITRSSSNEIEVAKLVELANKVLAQREGLAGIFSGEDDRESLNDILRVGTSAGGARAKAILAWNPKTGEFRSGQIKAPNGYEYWIIKFDGVNRNRDKEFIADPQGYGKIEYAYSLMAAAVGIKMSRCRLYGEGGRNHFMTKRFDREDDGSKIHMQTLCALAHVDFNEAGLFSYEEALQVMKRLNLPKEDLEQQVLRAIFNVVGRNQDDHVKNISFLMDQAGEWRLSPAYDVTYSYTPEGRWTSQHQMSINGKRDRFTKEDLFSLARAADLKSARAKEMLARVIEVVKNWPDYADEAGVDSDQMLGVQASQVVNLLD